MSEPENCYPRLLSTSDLERAVYIQSQAFQNDPLWQYMIPDADKRKWMLPKFFRVFLNVSIRSRQAYGVGDPVEGVALWCAPHQRRFELSESFIVGVLRLATEGFLSPFLRALKVFSRTEIMQGKYAPGPHYYLNTIAVLPEAQGKGFASKLILPFLEKADEESVGIYVETMARRNVGLYEHFGFQCVEQYQVPKTELTVWAFYRST
jgi:ribosomal protein S18 acetylase RimI-like enzyme